MEDRTEPAGSAKIEIARIRANEPMECEGVQDLVPWWSFTKTVIAIAVLRLSELGAIHLDRPMAGRPYSPSQLLRHQAGLPDYGALSNYHADVAAGLDPWSPDRLLHAVKADHLLFEPGTGWAYSNIGYLFLRRLIEEASGRPFATALATLVFAQAELGSAHLAEAREHLIGVNMGDISNYHPRWVYHGLVVGTVGDAAKLLSCLLQGKLLAAGTMQLMLEPTPLPQFRSANHPDPGYGMGLMLNASNPLDHPIGHGGSGPGSDIAVYCLGGDCCAIWASSASGIQAEGETLRWLQRSQRASP